MVVLRELDISRPRPNGRAPLALAFARIQTRCVTKTTGGPNGAGPWAYHPPLRPLSLPLLRTAAAGARAKLRMRPCGRRACGPQEPEYSQNPEPAGHPFFVKIPLPLLYKNQRAHVGW